MNSEYDPYNISEDNKEKVEGVDADDTGIPEVPENDLIDSHAKDIAADDIAAEDDVSEDFKEPLEETSEETVGVEVADTSQEETPEEPPEESGEGSAAEPGEELEEGSIEEPLEEAPEKITEQPMEPTEENVRQAQQSYASSSGQQPVYPAKKSRRGQYIALFVVLILIIAASFAVIFSTFDSDFYPGGDKVAVIYVQGVMLSGSVPGGFGFVTSEEVSENLRNALDDEDVKAIVLRVNSPGGSPAASEEIVTEIKRAQDEGIPVVVSMGDVAASAAYYISAPCDRIIANPSTMTGSIGVIWTFADRSEFYDEEGVDFHVAKSGDFKDMGADWRSLTDEEKEYADKVILDVFDRFVETVAEGRGMDEDVVREIADGRIYTGAEAKDLGLVDDFGNLYEATDVAAELGEVEGDYTIVYMNKPTLSRLLFGSESQSSASEVDDLVGYFEDNPFGKITALSYVP